jgi:hypothetical protein
LHVKWEKFDPVSPANIRSPAVKVNVPGIMVVAEGRILGVVWSAAARRSPAFRRLDAPGLVPRESGLALPRRRRAAALQIVTVRIMDFNEHRRRKSAILWLPSCAEFV